MALPSSAEFTGSTTTEAQFKAAITSLRDFLAGLLGVDGTEITALRELGVLLANRDAKTAAYTVVSSDRGKLIDCTSGTWTLSLSSVAALGSGFALVVKNSGAGTITIDPYSTETIDGLTTKDLSPGESIALVSGVANWFGCLQASTVNGALRVIRTYTSSTTWTRPSGLKRVRVRIQAGGAGGQYAGGVVGSGGGGGGYAEKLIELAALGATESVVVGAGGVGGTYYATSGGSGGSSSFGAHCSATGGAVAGGDGGVGIGGDFNIKGGDGSAGANQLSVYPGVGGNGGGSHMGGAGGGRGGASGRPGGLYGGGGAGGGVVDLSASDGGSGAPGVVIVEEYY